MIYIADDETLLLPMLNELRDDTCDKLDTSKKLVSNIN